MAHLLLAWELGLGLGHLTPLGLLAHHLSERGHRITLALRQRRHLDALPFPLPFDVIDAPHHDGEAPGGIALSYADMLRRCGYDRPEDALRLYRRWDALLAELKPDMVVAEHAPSALLAAHAGGLPRIAVGNGFTIPPPAGASAALQPWRENDNAALDAAEARVMRAISAICRAAAGAPPLAHSGALIGDTPPALKIFRECDLYQRDNAAGGAVYCGPVFAEGGARPAGWVDRPGPRLVAYLSPRFAQAAALLKALEQRGVALLNYLFGHGQPLDLPWALKHADAVLCHGGAGTIGVALSQGCRLAIVPMQLEQLLAGDRLAQQKLARLIRPDRDAAAIADAVCTLLDDRPAADRTAAFAQRYRDHSPAGALARAGDLIEAALN